MTQILFQQSGTTRMTTTKAYDNLNRLTAISNAPSADSAITFSYQYNSANQRTRRTDSDSSYWIYGYDGLGQVISGKKYWSDGTPVAGQQFEYGFDDIGNRKYAASGGDQWGSNLRYDNYTANNLNQYTQRTVPGAVDVLGAVNSNATITVNNTPSYRKVEYFRNQFPITNGSASVWQPFTNLAVLANGTNADITLTNIGNLFVPQTPETFGYDLDGNLTGDGRWVYFWDAENRLTQMVSSNVTDAAKVKLEFSYDYKFRRVEKKVSNWAGGAWQLSYDNRFMYDGWVLLGEINMTNSAVLLSLLWGQDLGPSKQSGGGIGGLLSLSWPSRGVYFATYEGNGNIVGLTASINGASSAQYEYSPFARMLRSTEIMGSFNPFRYSTKYTDASSELYYYTLRYFNPITGVWLSRDPIHEAGGENIYGFVRNNPIGFSDAIGLAASSQTCCCCALDLELINLSDFDGTFPPRAEMFYGHHFEVRATLEYEKNPKAGGCTIKWKEKTNYPYVQGMPANEFTDMFPLVPNSTAGNAWAARKEPCCTANYVLMPDDAALPLGDPTFTETRILEFDIQVFSAPGCPCANPSKQLKAKQTITIFHGRAIDRRFEQIP